MKKSLPIIIAIVVPVIIVSIFIWRGSVKENNILTGQNQLSAYDINNKIDQSLIPPSATPGANSSPSANTPNPTVASKSNIGDNPLTMTTPPQMQIDKNKLYSATLKTELGEIVVSLNAKTTPITVNNFVFLSKSKFYDNTVFHRIIKGFMIQGGDPKGDGTGGPGYKFNDEPFTGEYTRGTLAMANAGPNTNGSQFFIMHADTGLAKNYVIFGKVTSGLDVVDKIATASTKPGGEGSSPVNPVKIQSVEITEQ